MYIKLAIAIVLFTIGSLVGSTGANIVARGKIKTMEANHQKFVNEKLLEEQKARQALQDLINTERAEKDIIAAQLEKSLKTVKVVEKNVREIITKEIEKPVYRDCVLPSTGVRNLREAAVSNNAAANGSSSSESATQPISQVP